MIYCTSCQNNKDVLNFSYKTNGKLYKTCNTCRKRKRKVKTVEEMTEEERLEKNRKYREWYNRVNYKLNKKQYNIKNKDKRRLIDIVHSGKKKDIKHNRYDANNHIDKDFIEMLMSESINCVYCNIVMSLLCGEREDHLLTVERIDNKIGHIKSNCVLACWGCNNRRGTKYTFDEFLILAQDTASETERVLGETISP